MSDDRVAILRWLALALCASLPSPLTAQAPEVSPPAFTQLVGEKDSYDAEKGMLVVFVAALEDAEPQSAVQRAFRSGGLPDLVALAKQQGAALRVYSAGAGSPAEIKLTPLVVYQNFRGRSIYQGRTTTPDRATAFLRTARVLPQGTEPMRREKIPAMRVERATVATPIKITGISGSVPEDFDREVFEEEARAGIAQGLTRLKFMDEVELGKSDRSFYMDFYPWLSPEGELFVSVKLFSQFHCHEPVFTQTQEPFAGGWDERQKVFATAARALEHAMLSCISDPRAGDGFDAVPDATAVVSWEELGLALPPAPAQARNVPPADVEPEIHGKWELEAPAPGEPAQVSFHFPSPLDGYAGEAGSVSGQIRLDAAPGQPAGWIQADVRSVTMGDDVLDEAIMGSVFLNADEHSISRFQIRSIDRPAGPLPWATQVQATLHGDFRIRGKTQPLSVPAQLEATLGADGKQRLVFQTVWELDLRTFEMADAEGPEPQNHTLLFAGNFTFRAIE